MYTGPVKTRPIWPWNPDNDDYRSCDRERHLTRMDADRKYEAENRRCDMRKYRPGFAKLDDLRYGG